MAMVKHAICAHPWGPSESGWLLLFIYTLETLYIEILFRVMPLVQSLAPEFVFLLTEPQPYRERALWLGTDLSLRSAYSPSWDLVFLGLPRCSCPSLP